jgi:hypothetical protein
MGCQIDLCGAHPGVSAPRVARRRFRLFQGGIPRCLSRRALASIVPFPRYDPDGCAPCVWMNSLSEEGLYGLSVPSLMARNRWTSESAPSSDPTSSACRKVAGFFLRQSFQVPNKFLAAKVDSRESRVRPNLAQEASRSARILSQRHRPPRCPSRGSTMVRGGDCTDRKLSVDLLLMDDRDGVAAALSRGLIPIGTLGVLDLAARIGRSRSCLVRSEGDQFSGQAPIARGTTGAAPQSCLTQCSPGPVFRWRSMPTPTPDTPSPPPRCIARDTQGHCRYNAR